MANELRTRLALATKEMKDNIAAQKKDLLKMKAIARLYGKIGEPSKDLEDIVSITEDALTMIEERLIKGILEKK